VAAKASVAEKILQGKTVSVGTFQSDFDLREGHRWFFAKAKSIVTLKIFLREGCC
jgi:hypothetical protein